MDEATLKREIAYAHRRRDTLSPIAKHFIQHGNLTQFKEQTHALCAEHFGLEQGGDFDYEIGDCDSILVNYAALYADILERRLDHTLDLMEMYTPDRPERDYASQTFQGLAEECAGLGVNVGPFRERHSRLEKAPGKTGADFKQGIVESHLKYFNIVADQLEIELAMADFAHGREEMFAFSVDRKKELFSFLLEQAQGCLVQIKLTQPGNELPPPDAPHLN